MICRGEVGRGKWIRGRCVRVSVCVYEVGCGGERVGGCVCV